MKKQKPERIITKYPNGQIDSEHYFINNKRHRENGPAIIWYYKNGQIEGEHYFINNKELTKEQFIRYQREKRLKEIDKLIENLT